MKTKIIILTLVVTTLFSGCSKFLDLVPEKDVETIESIFEVRKSAFDFYNSCIAAVVKEIRVGDFTYDPSMICGGELVSAECARRTNILLTEVLSIPDGYQNTNNSFVNLWTMKPKEKSVGSVYTSIRYCNIFIENIDKVNDMPIWEKEAWKAEIKCAKAFYYFEMLKRYGPIVLIPKNIDPNDDIMAMQMPRNHVDTCFKEIVTLFDEAIPYLRTRNEIPSDFKTSFNLEAAYAYKARVLLYAASPLFNGNDLYAQFKNRDGKALFNSTYDKEKWKLAAEATDKAIQIAVDNKITLFQGTQTELTTKLNQIRDIQYSVLDKNFSNTGEWILMHMESGYNWQNILPRFKSGESLHNVSAWGCVSPNMAAVEMYYTDNGLPISKDKTWPYNTRYKMGSEIRNEYQDIIKLNDDVINLHLRREPRFYANIAAAGTYAVYGNTKYLVAPMKGESMGTELPRFNDGSAAQNITGYWVKKSLSLEAKPGSTTGYPVMLMRLSDLYLMQAEAWNEYSGPSEKVYDAMDKVRTRAGILPIRQAWTQFSTSPKDITMKDELRKIIHQERMIEFMFEGHHFWDLRRWKKAEDVLNKPHTGWNVMGKDERTFYNNFERPIIVHDKVQFISPRDYFWPINSEEIMISNIVQNPGW